MTLRQRKEKRRTYWLVDLGRIQGRRQRRCFRRRGAAQAFLKVARKEAQQHGHHAFALSDAERVELLAARDRLRAAGFSLNQAVEFVLQRRPKREATLRDAIDECVEAKRASGKRAGYVAHFESTLLGFAAGRGDRLVSAIERDEIEAWLTGNGWAAATRKNHRGDVLTFFTWAVSRGYAAEVPALERVSLEAKPPGILSVEQCRKLLATVHATDRGLLAYLVIGLFAGVRPQEIRALTWADVDLRRRFVQISGKVAKDRRRRLVRLSANAIAWLRLGGELPVKNFFRRWARARQQAELNARPHPGPLPQERVASWPHDALRHSFASYHLAHHQSQDLTAHEPGHGSPAMLFAHYREVVTPAAARAFWAITPRSLKLKAEKIVRWSVVSGQ